MPNQLYTSVLIKAFNKVYDRIRTDTLTLIHIGRASEVFHDEVIFFVWAAPHVTIKRLYQLRGGY